MVDRPGRADLAITAPEADAMHPYIDAVRLDGHPLRQSWTHGGLPRTGGRLDFRLSEQPNSEWGTAPGTLPE